MIRFAWISILFTFCSATAQIPPLLQVKKGKRYFQTADGKPFFWLGDTGWLLFAKCNREDALRYLDARQKQGYNVIQVMVLHDVNNKNAYGDHALQGADVSKPETSPGNDFSDTAAYDYWDHVDFIVDEAAGRGMYVGMVAVWGSNVKSGKVNANNAAAYAEFLARRYRDRNNIIWIDGGDIPGNEGKETWLTIARTLRQFDTRHIMTFHPRGRYSSSDWFHAEPWLDFNMVQSGHKDYAQDTSSREKHHYGEDNWKFIEADYRMKPVKPTLDGEPSYENIPHGLHDSLAERWTAADVRRYAYWSVFAGGAGFTYGENAIMQFYRFPDGRGSFGVNKEWTATLEAPGALQMHWVKDLVTRFPGWQDRVPAQDILVNNTGDRYDYNLATKGKKFALVYTYTGKPLKVNIRKLGFGIRKASWFDPSTGEQSVITIAERKAVMEFVSPGSRADGTDWVLILE